MVFVLLDLCLKNGPRFLPQYFYLDFPAWLALSSSRSSERLLKKE